MKNIFLCSIILILIASSVDAEKLPASKATGIFLGAGVGPRLPVGSFATSTDLGYGFNLELSYTDSDNLPFFIFVKIGFEQYPGSQSYYQTTVYSNYSTQAVPINLGVRYYLGPLVSSAILLMPVFEVAASFSYIQNLHQFKVDSGRNNFTEEISKFGGSVGIGISMFLLEIIAAYNYFESNQYISFNLNVRLPLIINL
ncbi:MAG TPA: hypothetical protein VI362_02090 [Ignavibacteriaceae bacterium]|nr:hypothetical protein [Ignavibacteriaceae bacterium]